MHGDDEDPREVDDPILRAQDVYQIGHAGRVVRVLLAWLLSAIGLLYAGWGGLGLVFLGPAAVLLAFAAGNGKGRGVVLLCSLPTVIGLCLAIDSLVRAPRGLPVALAATIVVTLLAALVAGPRTRR